MSVAAPPRDATAAPAPVRRNRRFHDLRDRAWMLGVFLGTFGLLRLVAVLALDDGRAPVSGLERLLSLGMYGWIATVPSVVAGVVAWLVPRRSRTRRGDARVDTEVSWRVVSRGINPEALRETVLTIRSAMEARPLFPYRIEVVTDTPVELPGGADVRALVVPQGYRPPNGSRFKARALHWALAASDLPDDGWVVHLDEESHPTSGVVGGVRDFLADAQESGDAPVGQGTILYYRHLRQRPILTMADSLRTGDDISRFFAQYRAGIALFGMHGSFIVVRNDVARGTGFDVGPDGSITEDAWWALQLLQRGHRFAWVDGHVVEQAPETIDDFVKQRRRWFSGLVKVALYAPAPWWATASMLTFLSLWAGATLGVAYTWLNIVLGLATPGWLAVTGALCYAWYVTLYVAGLRMNLAYHDRDLAPVAPGRRALLYVGQVVLMPLFAGLEMVGVAYALVRPERGFHVISKSVTGDPAPAGARTVAAGPSWASEVAPVTPHRPDRRREPDRRADPAPAPPRPRPIPQPAVCVVRLHEDRVEVQGRPTPVGPISQAVLRQLALAPDGLRAEELGHVVWGPTVPRPRVAAAVGRLRAVLGPDVVPRCRAGTYRLGDGVVVDRRSRPRRRRAGPRAVVAGVAPAVPLRRLA